MEPITTPEGFVEIYKAFLSSGLLPGAAFQKVVSMGYLRSQGNLRRQIRLLDATGDVSARVEIVGRKQLLSESQKQECAAWIELQNDTNEDIERRDLQKFILDSWDIKTSLATISNLGKELRMSRRVPTCRTQGYSKTREELRAEYYEFLVTMKKQHWFERPMDLITSIDTVYTRKPKQKVMTIAPVGSPQPKSKKKCGYTRTRS